MHTKKSPRTKPANLLPTPAVFPFSKNSNSRMKEKKRVQLHEGKDSGRSFEHGENQR